MRAYMDAELKPHDLRILLDRALIEAVSMTKNLPFNNQQGNRKRSSQWVESVANQFKSIYQEDESIRIFSKGFPGNRELFGINELLYDILVCEINVDLKSPSQKRKLAYITKALWQIESEFGKSTKEVFVDFNKLVIGESQQKLFIGASNDYQHEIKEALIHPAKCCQGDVYLAFVPHPNTWDGEKLEIELWRKSNGWVPIL